jgi:hypothetical protein
MIPPIPINIAVEDELLETMAVRILSEINRNYATNTVYNRGGFGYLKKNISAFNFAARAGTPYLVMTDLDDQLCPSELIRSWLQNTERNPNLLIRVAVREAEAWLLADDNKLPTCIGVSSSLFPGEVEQLPNPKGKLLELIGRSKQRGLKKRLCPAPGSTAKIGPEYNAFFAEFVLYKWDFDRARSRSASLRRTVDRLNSFAPSWS